MTTQKSMSPEEIAYESFLRTIVSDAIDNSKEMDIHPRDALEHIIECIHEDAAEILDGNLPDPESPNFSI